jgi:hypothetical protein
MTIQLREFLSDSTDKFLTDLWKLLNSAQNELTGIPTELLEKKKMELLTKRV